MMNEIQQPEFLLYKLASCSMLVIFTMSWFHQTYWHAITPGTKLHERYAESDW